MVTFPPNSRMGGKSHHHNSTVHSSLCVNMFDCFCSRSPQTPLRPELSYYGWKSARYKPHYYYYYLRKWMRADGKLHFPWIQRQCVAGRQGRVMHIKPRTPSACNLQFNNTLFIPPGPLPRTLLVYTMWPFYLTRVCVLLSTSLLDFRCVTARSNITNLRHCHGLIVNSEPVLAPHTRSRQHM